MNILKYIFPSLRPKIMAKTRTFNMNAIHHGIITSKYRTGEVITGTLEKISNTEAWIRDESGLYKVSLDTLIEVK